MEIQKLLSECDELKARLSALRPLPKKALDKINNANSIDYTYESNRIEGNTLTLQETALVVNDGITISGKSMREHLEAINHAEAVDYIRELAQNKVQISERVIKDLHTLVLRGIDRSNAGVYRSVPVLISGSTHVPPQPYLLQKFIEDFMLDFERMEKEKQHPIITAAFLHKELVRIHPFIDGNGRTSRLLMNLYLLQNSYPIVSLKGDNESKVAYYTALEHSRNNFDEFAMLIANATKTSLEKYLSVIG